MENTDADLATYEGRYPKDLFNKTVVANGQAVGRVAKETDDFIVVFGDSDNSSFDVPESKGALTGGSVVVNEPLEKYTADKDAPPPGGRGSNRRPWRFAKRPAKSLNPSLPVEEYRASGRELERTSRSVKEKMKDTGATAADDLEGAARQAASGTRVAKKKAKEK